MRPRRRSWLARVRRMQFDDGANEGSRPPWGAPGSHRTDGIDRTFCAKMVESKGCGLMVAKCARSLKEHRSRALATFSSRSTRQARTEQVGARFSSSKPRSKRSTQSRVLCSLSPSSPPAARGAAGDGCARRHEPAGSGGLRSIETRPQAWKLIKVHRRFTSERLGQVRALLGQDLCWSSTRRGEAFPRGDGEQVVMSARQRRWTSGSCDLPRDGTRLP